jgi:hypothetical protein
MVTTLPKVTWGASFANTLNIGYPLDNAVAYPEPRKGYAIVEAPSGARDSWIPGTAQRLAGDARWIPAANTTTPLATGWDTSSTGFAAFLTWARAQNPFRFFPDATSGTYLTCYLVEPMEGEPPQENDGTRHLRIVIQTIETESSVFTGY